MKNRRHHNNKGYSQIGRGKTREQVAAIARKLRIPMRNAQELQEQLYVAEMNYEDAHSLLMEAYAAIAGLAGCEPLKPCDCGGHLGPRASELYRIGLAAWPDPEKAEEHPDD